MNEVFSSQDWQLLSEYLDNQLSPSEKEKVERLLRSSQTWHQNYQSLSATKIILHSAPRKKATKNFTLTREQADLIRKPTRNWFSFRITSLVSTALAVGMFMIGIFARVPQTTTLSSAPVMEKDMASVEATSIPIIIWGPPGTNPYPVAGGYRAFGRGGGGGGGGDGTYAIGGGTETDAGASVAPPAAEAFIEPAPMQESNSAQPEFIPQPAPTAASMKAPEAPPLAEAQEAPDARSSSQSAGNPILGIQSLDEAQSIEEFEAANDSNAPSQEPINLLWIGSALLLIIGLVSGYLSIRHKNIR